jgi:hypothetical protein
MSLYRVTLHFYDVRCAVEANTAEDAYDRARDHAEPGVERWESEEVTEQELAPIERAFLLRVEDDAA